MSGAAGRRGPRATRKVDCEQACPVCGRIVGQMADNTLIDHGPRSAPCRGSGEYVSPRGYSPINEDSPRWYA